MSSHQNSHGDVSREGSAAYLYLRFFAPLLAWGRDGGLAGEGRGGETAAEGDSPRVSAEMDVTHMGQNANSQYAMMVASNKKAPERCAKYGIKNQGTALSG